MELPTLQARKREVLGTRASRRLRETGAVPIVIYGRGEPPEAVSVPLHDVQVALAHGARMLHVDFDGHNRPYLIKEVQYDHFGQTPLHLDLTRVAMDERVQVKVGIELRGTPKGVEEGGVLEQHLAAIDIECLPIDIPDTLHPLVVNLGIGESLLVGDLELPPNVKALVDPQERVVSVRMAAAEAEEEPKAEGEEEEAQPEVIGRTRKEEEGDKGGSS